MNLAGISHHSFARCAVRGASIPQSRSLHTTLISSDFFSWFKKKKAEESEPAVPSRATGELIKDIESGKRAKTVTNNQRLKLTPENFIGQEPDRLAKAARQKLVSEASFNNWISKKSVSSERRLEEHLIDSYNESFQGDQISTASDAKLDVKFPDLVTKFNFTKNLQAKTGYLIPDYTLTILSRPSQFKKYFLDEILSGKQARFKQSEPNAIHLTQGRFSSPNIYVVPDVNFKSQNKKYREIMKEVNSSEAELSKRAMEEVATN